uniref:Uncharacterized protein n=1 Tax=Pan paniscus TaxID=9597 RepID=A0A2R9A9B5_PANPA
MEGCVSNLMVCNLNSRTALHWACSARHAEIVEFVLQLGVPVSDKGDTASKNRNEIVVKLLEGRVDPHAEDHCEATAMHRAAAKGNLKMIPILLYYRTSTNIQDTEGNTPLHSACDEERQVSQGASIYIENKEEKTPLQAARGGLRLILK